MSIDFYPTKGTTCAIVAEIAKASLVDGNRALHGRKPLAISRLSNIADTLVPVTLNVTRKDQAEMATAEPIIAVVFTVGGPVVYERKNEQFA
jgi:hypothetical protein